VLEEVNLLFLFDVLVPLFLSSGLCAKDVALQVVVLDLLFLFDVLVPLFLSSGLSAKDKALLVVVLLVVTARLLGVVAAVELSFVDMVEEVNK
jgi:hypothetical protein